MNIVFGIISIFPELFNCLNYGITGRSLKKNIIQLNHWNPRHYCDDLRQNVDDRPYGGGPGMIMKVKPLRAAINAAKTKIPDSRTIYLSPQGQPLTQSLAETWSQKPKSLIFIAGRYEGIDERLLQRDIDEEWSIGDYILSGGELAIAVVIDVLTRLLPCALGDSQSAKQDSFSRGILDHPHYTRPKKIDEDEVPSVLLQGNHAKIAKWRLQQALGQTYLKRPDLLDTQTLDADQKALLEEFMMTHNRKNRGEDK